MSNPRRPLVFVPNKSAHDFSSAGHYGELRFVTTGWIDRCGVNTICRMFAEAMADSEPGDYIVVSGLSILVSVAAATMAHMHGKVNFLIFRNGEYVERNVDLTQLSDKEK